MAIERDILALLFSMSSLRGIYQTFYAGRARPQNAGELSSLLTQAFPSVDPVTATTASIALHAAFESGFSLSGLVVDRQNAAGSLWPAPGPLDPTSPFSDVVSGVNPPNIPGLSFPGASSGTQIYEMQYGVGTTTRLGTEDLIWQTAIVEVPIGSTYADVLEELRQKVEQHASKYEYEVDRLEGGEPDLQSINIAWGAIL